MAYLDWKTDLLAVSLAAFRKKATVARLAFTDLSTAANIAEQGDTIRITRVDPPGDPADASMSNVEGAIVNPSTHKFDLVVDQWKRYYWDASDKDAYDVGVRPYGVIAATYGAKLADYMERQLFLSMAAGSGFNNGTAGTTPFSANLEVMTAARKGLVERDVETAGLAAIWDPDASQNLLDNANFARADARGAEGVESGREGTLGRKFGLNNYESNNLPEITRRSADADVVGAHAAGVQSISVDGAGGTGIARGELLTNGTNTYAVVKGIAGASGSIEIDRPLAAALADNDVLARTATHQTNFAFAPSALAVAMRPTAPPMGGGGDGSIGSITDPETGFSLTLEVKRIVHGTRYYISGLWGARVVTPESIQRVLG